MVPLSLLLFPLLRARLPDIAYDSLSYKTTIPYQMAEWMTGGTAIIDGYMVGTNLQEMLNALLVALTGDWLPPLISSVAFVLLVLILPLAFPAGLFASRRERAVVAFAALSAFVLTEAQIDAGTAYQEPLLLLFLAASLIRIPAWPGFLAMAVAVKINAAFIAPLIVLYHVAGYRRFWRGASRLAIGVALGALVMAPQLGRNVALSGRLLGMNETLAAVTDPPGPHQVMAAGGTRYDARPRGGLLNNALASACNIWLLDAVCSVRFQGMTEAGFNVFPASRAPLFGAILAVSAFSGRRRRWLGCTAAGAFLAGYAGFLGFLSEDRYFLPLSFGFSLLLLIDPRQGTAFATPPWGLALAIWLAGSDLLPGTFTNASWICRRELTAPVQTRSLRGPETPVQAFLAAQVAGYKKVCPPPGLPPVILAENDRLNSPYLGTQRIFYVFTQAMITRFLAADPGRQAALGSAVLALVAEHPAYEAATLGPAATDFTPCFEADGLHVLCSIRLAPLGSGCAETLYR